MVSFNGLNSFNNSEPEYHLISTDSSYMQQIGLSVFTIKQLYDWMIQTDGSGEFVNLKYFADLESKPLAQNETLKTRIIDGGYANKIIGGDPANSCQGDKTWLYFSKWIRNAKGGVYSFTPTKSWTYYKQYGYSDLQFDSVSNKIVKLEKNLNGNFAPKLFDNPDGNIDEYISTIITMNDFIRLMPSDPRFYSDPKKDYLEKEFRAWYEYIMDIKTSKEKCIQWCSKITFQEKLGTANNAEICKKEECVHFKMYLYDFQNPPSQNRPAALNTENLFFSAPKTDVFGKFSNQDGTGRITDPAADSPSAMAQMDLTYNKSTNKLESGSPTVLIKLDQDLVAAQTLKTNKPGTGGHIPSFAKAIPIQEQNGNPFQWSTQYASSCAGSTDVFSILVQNHGTQFFPSGTIGYASRLSGGSAWSFIPMSVSETLTARADTKWSFTYLMMNYDNFFRVGYGSAINEVVPEEYRDTILYYTKRFTFDLYEEAVRKYYYNEFEEGFEEGLPQKDYYRHFLSQICPLQVTSWDFMGPNIGGLREQGNSLSNTVYGRKTNGEIWSDEEINNGATSSPFFGCVFPDGYRRTSFYDKYNSVDHPEIYAYPIGQNFIKSDANGLSISSNTPLFDNDNTNDTLDNGIFTDDAQKRSFLHLPADIALNASPNGSFGSPLVDYYKIFGAFDEFRKSPGDEYANNITRTFFNNNPGALPDYKIWLHEKNKPSVSVFDLEPNNPFRIQFRPLKNETYNAFEKPEPGGSGTFSFTSASLTKSQGSVVNINAIARIPTKPSLQQPRSNYSELKYDDSADMRLSSISGRRILKYNKLLLNANRLIGNKGNIFNSDLSARFPQGVGGYWSRNFLDPDPKPAGAFGVIGASCSVLAQKAIGFNTSFIIGLADWFGPASALLGPPKNWYASFGGQGDEYYSYHNTQLYVRIFQSWPSEYTIYDPAKFAVFHFNPRSDEYSIIYYDNDKNDMSTGTRVYSNALGYSSSNIVITSFTQRIDNRRMTKLLPYKFKLEGTIGISILIAKIAEGSDEIKASDCDIIIYNKGVGYTQDDIFQINGGMGKSPILLANVDTSTGSITGFRYENPEDRGYDYSPFDFPASDEIIYVPSGVEISKCGPRITENQDSFSPGLEIVPVEVNGTGFSGRVVAGIYCDSIELVDPKPVEITNGALQLTGSIPTSPNSVAEARDELNGSLFVSAAINPADASPNSKYDLFFHFHNDISHTIVEQKGVLPVENYVEVEIIPQ